MVMALSTRLKLRDGPLSLAISGGVLLHQPRLVARLQRSLADAGIGEVTITPVADAVAGSLSMAMKGLPDGSC
jgi:hypothetical protein